MKLTLILLYAASIFMPVQQVNKHVAQSAKVMAIESLVKLQPSTTALSTSEVYSNAKAVTSQYEVNKYSLPMIIVIE